MVELFVPDAFADPEIPNYYHKLTPPTVDPDDGGTAPSYCIPINCQWVPIVIGALKLLKHEGVWKVANTDELAIIMGRVNCLIAEFESYQASHCISPPPALACPYDFAVSDGGWTPICYTFHGSGCYIPDGSTYCSAVYAGGTGWQAVWDCTNSLLYIETDISADVITQVRVRGFCSDTRQVGVQVDGTVRAVSGDVTGNFDVTLLGDFSGTFLLVTLTLAFTSNVDAYFYEIVLSGTGTDCP